MKSTASVFFLLVLLFLHTTLFSQETQVRDSISQLISGCQFPKALELLNRQLVIHPQSAPLWYEQGMAFKGLAKHMDAINSFTIALKLEPNNIQSLLEISNCYKMTGRINKALICLAKADSLMPNISIKIELAGLLYNSDRYSEALYIYLGLFRSDTENIFLARSVGHCYSNIDLKDSAILFYEKAAKLNPVDFQSVYRASLLYLDKKAYLKGIALTNRYLASDSTDTRINRMNAYLYLLTGSFDTALIKFSKCIVSKDTSVFVNKYLGVTYLKMEDYLNAKIFLEKAYSKDSMDAKTCNYLGISCMQSYYKKLGIKYLNRAIQLTDPLNMAALYKNLAEGYNGFYMPKDGLEAFIVSHDLNPGDTFLLYKIAYQYDFEFKDFDNSMKYYQEFLKTRPVSDANHPEKKIKYMAYTTYDKKSGKMLEFSFYDLAEKRVKEIQEWMRKKNKN